MKKRTLSTGRTVNVHDDHAPYKRCRCPRRKWLTCPHSYAFAFKWRGQHYRCPLDRYCDHHIVTVREARQEADRLRTVIRATGEFPQSSAATSLSPSPAGITFEIFGQLWLTRARATASTTQQQNDKAILAKLSALSIGDTLLGDRRIGQLTEDDLETAFQQLAHLAGSTWNKYFQLVSHMQKWGKRKGHLDRLWLSDDTDLKRKKGKRRERRLVPDELDVRGEVTAPGEERRLLAHAGVWLQNLIIAAIETCRRRGELLSLQWRDVSLARLEITILAEHEKTRKLIRTPISPRLAGILEMLRLDPRRAPAPASRLCLRRHDREADQGPEKAVGPVSQGCGNHESPLPRFEARGWVSAPGGWVARLACATHARTLQLSDDQHLSERHPGRAQGLDAATRNWWFVAHGCT